MGLVTQNLPLMAWLVLVACGLVCAWALFWDRPRGRVRCRRCRYRMEGVPAQPGGSVICPECGRKHASVGKLHHTHRRWRVAVSCLLIGLVGWYALSFHWRFRERGWMGYVPTTVIVLLPESAEAWFDACDGPLATTQIAQEMSYRTDTVGLHLWQETLWVWNLRRGAESRAVEDWKWRFVRKKDLSGRHWSRHQCDRFCGSFVYQSTGSRRLRCPGPGTLQLQAEETMNGESWGSHDIDYAMQLVAKIHNLTHWEAEYRKGFGLRLSEDDLAIAYSGWPRWSSYQAYYSNDRCDQLVHEGLGVLYARPNWLPGAGWTDEPDYFCVVNALYGRLRLFDLHEFYKAVGIANTELAHDGTQLSFVRWLLDQAEYSFYFDGGGTAEKPVLCFPHRDRLYIASTPQGHEEAAAKLQALYEKVKADPDCWRRATRDTTSP